LGYGTARDAASDISADDDPARLVLDRLALADLNLRFRNRRRAGPSGTQSERDRGAKKITHDNLPLIAGRWHEPLVAAS